MQKFKSKSLSFIRKVWIVVGISTFTVLFILLVIKAANAFLLILAGSLIAIFFTGLSSLIKRKTGWKKLALYNLFDSKDYHSTVLYG